MASQNWQAGSWWASEQGRGHRTGQGKGRQGGDGGAGKGKGGVDKGGTGKGTGVQDKGGKGKGSGGQSPLDGMTGQEYLEAKGANW